MCRRACVCLASRSPPLIFHGGTRGLILTSRFCLPSLLPISMTMASSCLHTQLILRSLDQFIIGLTQRNSMLPKIGSAWMTSISNRPPIHLNWYCILTSFFFLIALFPSFMYSWFYISCHLQTRKFFIKVLVRNESILNFHTSDLEDNVYNLKRDGWLNSFTDAKNQTMRADGVPWRGPREKGPDFFNVLFSALTVKDDIIFDWQCGVGSFFNFLFLMSLFFLFHFICALFITHWFSFPNLFGFICSRKFHHFLPLPSTPHCCIRIWHWCLQVHPPTPSRARSGTLLSTLRPSTRISFRSSSSSKDGEAQFRFALCVSSFLSFNLFGFISSTICVSNFSHFLLCIALCAEFIMIAPSASLMRRCLQHHRDPLIYLLTLLI